MKILGLFLAIIGSTILYGQNIEYKSYSYHVNSSYSFDLSFSFDIPKSWTINQEYDGTGYFLNCKSTVGSETVEYNNCFDSVLFRTKYFHCDIDSALIKMGLQKNTERIYITRFNGKTKVEVAADFKGDTYTGLYYTIIDDITCKGNKRHKIIGNYQFIYFSDGKQTICIITNGKKLDDLIFTRIRTSFKFN